MSIVSQFIQLSVPNALLVQPRVITVNVYNLR